MLRQPSTCHRALGGLILAFLLTLHLPGLSEARQQFFRVQPQDVEVAEGGVAVIQCEVGNREGRVQWTKDGLTLGYERSIPGIPRYHVLGSDNSGQFSLQISNVSIEDDADFECQVGPANYNRPIRHSAHLHVLLAPTAIEMVNYAAGQRIDIKENEEISLTCKVTDAKPKADIVWYRNDVRFTTDDVSTSVEDGSGDGRKTATSTITFRPTSRDNKAHFACEAKHTALQSRAMRVSVVLSVQYPPGPPEIQGYMEGETIRLGQSVTLICTSHGGNPLAEIVWYKNGEGIDYSYTTSGRESRNMFNFIAAADDNNARYRCEARNHMNTEPMSAEIVVAVQFAPDKVTISGPSEAKVGDILGFKCTTGNSNPSADIKWLVDGVEVSQNRTEKTSSPDGGWVSTSELNVAINPNDRRKMISCYAINIELGETIVETHVVNVLYPPGSPNITGVASDTVLEEGQLKRLLCMSMGGNPLADLAWFKDDVKIEGTTTIKSNSSFAKSELEVITNRSDNGKLYRCEASNAATAVAKTTHVRLAVQFRPLKVDIQVDPASPKAGNKAVLKCETGSSNPTATILWRYKGRRLESSSEFVQAGEFGGNITKGLLEIDVTPEHENTRFICEAKNPATGQSVHDALTLSVKYEPIFPQEPSDGSMKVFQVEEGKSLVIDLSAKANPSSDLKYKWTNKDGATIPSKATTDDQRMLATAGKLNITVAKREDAGQYKVRASNSEGKTSMKFKLEVHYEPRITEITDEVMAAPGDSAEFGCIVEANPLREDTVKWTRDDGVDFDMATRTIVTNVSNAIYLTVKNVTAKDSGTFACIANNGIGNEIKNVSYLLVRSKPEIDESPSIAKSASDKGATGVLLCRAKGVPEVSFSWSRRGQVIAKSDGDTSDGSKYAVKHKSVDRFTWESELSILRVNSTDYGRYDCIAQNEEGHDRYAVHLNVTSRPDPPLYLRVINVTYNSVKLSWTPGFDGGFPQTFRIRYRKADGALKNYHYLDVPRTDGVDADNFEVQDLKDDTKYEFSLMAHNTIGESEFSNSETVTVSTKEIPISSVRPDDIERGIAHSVVVTVTLVAGCLLLLNVVLITCYVKRKRNGRAGVGKHDKASYVASSSSATAQVLGRESGASSEPSVLLITLTSVCAVLLVLINVALASCLLRRFRRRKEEAKESAESSTGSSTCGGEGGSTSGSAKSATIEMYVGTGSSSFGANDTMSGETLSSISEKSGSFISSSEHQQAGQQIHYHAGGGSGGHHHHHHHQTTSLLSPAMEAPEEEEAAEAEDHFQDNSAIIISHPRGAATTYLTDDTVAAAASMNPGSSPGHQHVVYGRRDPTATTSYATMPRRPPQANGHVHMRGGGGGGGAAGHGPHLHSHGSLRHHHSGRSFHHEEIDVVFRRQPYVQGLDIEVPPPPPDSSDHDIYVPDPDDFPSPPPGVSSYSSLGLRRKGPPPPPPPPNGLYVTTADGDELFPPARPPPPPGPSAGRHLQPQQHGYPEDMGHLV